MVQTGPAEAGVKYPVSRQLLDVVLQAQGLPDAPFIMVAFSGGMDSTVLLHLLYLLRQQGQLHGELCAVHVDHGLQPAAASWSTHCQHIAAELDIPLQQHKADVLADVPQLGLEGAARKARYALFEALLPPGGLLLQAHHLDDHAETVLLHLLRGSGPRGLAGIPSRRTLGKGELLRPLLACHRHQLQDHAVLHGLSWVEDPSNQDTSLERNYIRHRIMPVLLARWPAARESLGHSAAHCADARDLLAALAQHDLSAVLGKLPNQLGVAELLQLDPVRQRNLLYQWAGTCCRTLGVHEPPAKVLQEVLATLLPAREDSCPVVRWGRGENSMEFQRFRGNLYLLRAMSPVPAGLLQWDTREVLRLPGTLGSLEYLPGESPGERQAHRPLLQVGFRKGGERIKPALRPTRSLKNLLQELAVPPWLRSQVPLVYANGKLLAVAGLCYAESWAAFTGSDGATIVWKRPDLH